MNIGIIGSGISGLQLALRLQQFGVETTVYSQRTAEEQRAGRPANFVNRFGRTRDRERALGVAHWDFPDWESHTIRLTFGPQRLRADLEQPASGVDFRVYLPRLLEDYTARGGTVVIGPVEAGDVHRHAERHDLVVVASGGRSIAELFPRDPGRSPYTAPQRRICAGLFHGVGPADRPGVDYHISPGAGEIFSYPFYSLAGKVTLLGFEAVPGGPLEPLTHFPAEEDPAGYRRAVLDVLAEHMPALRERVDEAEFALTRPLDALRGAVTPVVRHGWSTLDNGRHAVAVGDAWVVNDPITAQGANLGAECAFLLADAIRAADRFDERFCRATEARLWSAARPVVEWTNAFLQPPPPHVLSVLRTATTDDRVAHAFVNGFNDPRAMWDSLATPDQAAAFLAGTGAQPLAEVG